MTKREARILAIECIATHIMGMDANKFAVAASEDDESDLMKIYYARLDIVEELHRRARKLKNSI